MMLPLIDMLAAGGCYWPSKDPGYAHGFAVPSGTRFSIALHGPKSRFYVSGICREGWFEVLDGEHARTRFPTASRAVNTVREPSTNAYLHVRFEVDGRWEEADRMRELSRFAADAGEERAIKLASDLIRVKLREAGRKLEDPDLFRSAAKLVQQRPTLAVEGRRQVEEERNMGVVAIVRRPGDGSWSLA
ncbi:hypothetical protein [Muricoccus vinaceus]|uniref:Uncharacterized protein n=1 Tax=Muricoccus vinaceus TaxID=424704 RepID=A0ABV6IT67_9PROT